jgi:2-dehydro-3-deoxyphosphogluconate aldolase/(4S)-4-hydroxy-2-oxoglutarate aldolase
MLKALHGRSPTWFLPDRRHHAETAPQFLALPNVRVCGGSWLTPNDAVEARDWARITALAKGTAQLRKA